MDSETEKRIAHLAMIQAIIARMASNAFTLKTLSATITAGLVAVLGSTSLERHQILIAGGLTLVVFAWLDAKFFRLEKLFRALYDDVRDESTAVNFDMSVKRFDGGVPTTYGLASSWPILGFYAVLLCVLAFTAIAINHH